MNYEETVYLMALQKVPLLGEINARRLLSRLGSARAIFSERESNLLKIDGIGEMTVKNLRAENYLKLAEEEFQLASQKGIGICTLYDEAYPYALSHCPDAPLVVFTKGDIKCNVSRIISIVGTRNATPYGLSVCEKLISELAVFEPLIVSGLAYGIDIAAHKFAMEEGLQTIACLAHGLDHVYPSAHGRLAEEMQRNGGLLTDFWSTQLPERNHFLRRNRIIAGLAHATVVIESGEKGGSLITAEMALHYNREVFAVPGRITDTYSKGCLRLISSQSAHVLTSAADLAYILGWELPGQEKSASGIQKQLFVDLPPEEQKVYDLLKSRGRTSLDDLAFAGEMPVYHLQSLLLNMEMKGVVQPLPGRLFEAI